MHTELFLINFSSNSLRARSVASKSAGLDPFPADSSIQPNLEIVTVRLVKYSAGLGSNPLEASLSFLLHNGFTTFAGLTGFGFNQWTIQQNGHIIEISMLSRPNQFQCDVIWYYICSIWIEHLIICSRITHILWPEKDEENCRNQWLQRIDNFTNLGLIYTYSISFMDRNNFIGQ